MTIDEPLLRETSRLTGERSRSKAVNAALGEWVRMRKLKELAKLRGTMDIRYDVAELRALEMAEAQEDGDGAG